ncbi:unnamed protein product [Amoebophrya sp. A25]|nr:unnamed protein product [Amoebophrya sp. A25]|eukprot:GSA25T00002129001.1
MIEESTPFDAATFESVSFSVDVQPCAKILTKITTAPSSARVVAEEEPPSPRKRSNEDGEAVFAFAGGRHPALLEGNTRAGEVPLLGFAGSTSSNSNRTTRKDPSASSHEDASPAKVKQPMDDSEKYPWLHRLQIVKDGLLSTRSRQERYFARACPELGRPCFICNQVGHTKKDCPQRVCYRCNKRGHLASECPTKNGALKISGDESRDESVVEASWTTKPDEAIEKDQVVTSEAKATNSEKKKKKKAKKRSSKPDEHELGGQPGASGPISLLRSLKKQKMQDSTMITLNQEFVAASSVSQHTSLTEDHLYDCVVREESLAIQTAPFVGTSSGDASCSTSFTSSTTAFTSTKEVCKTIVPEQDKANEDDLFLLQRSAQPTEAPRCLICFELGHGLGLDKCPKVIADRRRKYEERQAHFRQQRVAQEEEAAVEWNSSSKKNADDWWSTSRSNSDYNDYQNSSWATTTATQRRGAFEWSKKSKSEGKWPASSHSTESWNNDDKTWRGRANSYHNGTSWGKNQTSSASSTHREERSSSSWARFGSASSSSKKDKPSTNHHSANSWQSSCWWDQSSKDMWEGDDSTWWQEDNVAKIEQSVKTKKRKSSSSASGGKKEDNSETPTKVSRKAKPPSKLSGVVSSTIKEKMVEQISVKQKKKKSSSIKKIEDVREAPSKTRDVSLCVGSTPSKKARMNETEGSGEHSTAFPAKLSVPKKTVKISSKKKSKSASSDKE